MHGHPGFNPHVYKRNHMGSYAKFDAMLQGRCATSRKVANNTYLKRRDDKRIAVRLHSTDILTYHEDGIVEFNMNDYNTMLTRGRMAEFGPPGFSVHSHRDVPYISQRIQQHDDDCDSPTACYCSGTWRRRSYYDGILVDTTTGRIRRHEEAGPVYAIKDGPPAPANWIARKTLARCTGEAVPDVRYGWVFVDPASYMGNKLIAGKSYCCQAGFEAAETPQAAALEARASSILVRVTMWLCINEVAETQAPPCGQPFAIGTLFAGERRRGWRDHAIIFSAHNIRVDWVKDMQPLADAAGLTVEKFCRRRVVIEKLANKEGGL